MQLLIQPICYASVGIPSFYEHLMSILEKRVHIKYKYDIYLLIKFC